MFYISVLRDSPWASVTCEPDIHLHRQARERAWTGQPEQDRILKNNGIPSRFEQIYTEAKQLTSSEPNICLWIDGTKV